MVRDWIELVAILAILIVDVLLLVDSRAMVRLYTDYYAERRQARKAAVTRWRGKHAANTDAGGTGSVQPGMVSAVESWDSEGGATGATGRRV